MSVREYVALRAVGKKSSTNSGDRKRAEEEFRRSASSDLPDPSLGTALLDATGIAVRDAPAAKGRFPLVLYFHTEASSQGIQCEYLASWGFIVASTPVAGTFEQDIDVGISGAETEARDLEFARAKVASRIPGIDRSVLGVVGMSFGGISEFLFAERHPEVAAMVSLDGGAATSSGAVLVRQSPYFELARLRAPILHLYQPDGADLELLEGLRYADRTFGSFPNLRHKDFSGSGFFENISAEIRGKNAARQAGRKRVCELMARFLLVNLRGDPERRRLLERLSLGSGSDQEVPAVEKRARLPAPPLLEELREIVRKGGIRAVKESYEGLKERDPQPFSQETLRKLGSWLYDEGRAADARDLFELQMVLYPDSARAHYLFAMACRRVGDLTRAKEHFAKALELLPTDADIDVALRARIEKTSRETLQELSGAGSKGKGNP